MSTRHPLALALLVASLAACGNDAPTTAPDAAPPSTVAAATTPPQSSDTARSGGTTTTGGGRPDSTGTGATGATGDTTGTPADTGRTRSFPASVRVHGRLLVSSLEASQAPRGDSLATFAPVAGARITLFRNLLIEGRGVSQRIGEVATGADGRYQFQSVPGGYYVLALNVTPERPWGSNVAYAVGDKPELEVTLRFWRTPDGPSGSPSAPADTTRP